MKKQRTDTKGKVKFISENAKDQSILKSLSIRNPDYIVVEGEKGIESMVLDEKILGTISFPMNPPFEGEDEKKDEVIPGL